MPKKKEIHPFGDMFRILHLRLRDALIFIGLEGLGGQYWRIRKPKRKSRNPSVLKTAKPYFGEWMMIVLISLRDL